MAGSYNHIITDRGNLVSNERFVQMVENLGDAYETVEEMYGMIWYLANKLAPSGDELEFAVVEVEEARQNYTYGLKVAKEANRRGRSGGG